MGRGGAKGSASAKLVGGGLALLFKLIALALAIATPLLGVWVSSSLAAYLNGPIWLTIVVGLCFFPLLPLAWEGFAAFRRKRKKVTKERILTFTDRIVLRTLFLNFTFLAVLLAAKPAVGFTALQARGDWMLEGVDAPWAGSVRPKVFWVADRLEWIYDLASDNPYEDVNPDDDVIPTTPDSTGESDGSGDGADDGTVGERDGEAGGDDDAHRGREKRVDDRGRNGLGGRWGGTEAGDGGASSGDAGAGDATRPAKAENDAGAGQGGRADNESSTNENDRSKNDNERRRVRVLWPSSNELHPVVKSMPRSAEDSIESVARYIKQHESDELGRLRAAHDWVADRIAYDVPALDLPRLPPQDPGRIFNNRTGVCSGYALLLRKLGRLVGHEIVYVVGVSRGEDGSVSGGGHAWNAVKLDGDWHLIDATWNAGHVGDRGFTKAYSSRYYLAPPEVFGMNHFPDRPQWQLRDRPISRGDFIRLPMLDPRFFINEMRLLEPQRSQITVENEVVIRVDNPHNLFMLASFSRVGSNSNSRTRCEVQQGPQVRFNCRFPSSGSWRVSLFMNRQRAGSYQYVGKILVNRS